MDKIKLYEVSLNLFASQYYQTQIPFEKKLKKKKE